MTSAEPELTATAADAAVCDRCGRCRTIVSRRSAGSLCGSCYNASADRPQRRCGRCAKVARICVAATATTPDVCVACYDLPLATCRTCGRTRPCVLVAVGTPMCATCRPRSRAICAHCGVERPPAARWTEGPVCDTCYTAALRRRGICGGCGSERRLVSPPGPGATHCCDCAGVAPMAAHICSVCAREDKCYERGLCDYCSLRRRATEVMAGPDGAVPVALASVYDAIVASPGPRKVLNWLRRGAGAPILSAMAAGTMAVTHGALDAHPRPMAANYLRNMLVAHGALEPRDDQLVGLERRNAETVAAIERPEDRKVAAAFAAWHVLRRLRRRAGRNTTARTATAEARIQLVGAVGWLDWLAANDLSLATTAQGDLDRFLSAGPASRYNARAFVAWASERKLTVTLEVPPRNVGPGATLDAERRWTIIRRLLTEADLDAVERLAGCFVLLYAQPLSRIAVMTLDQVTVDDSGVSIRFGGTDLTVPDPFGALLADHLRTARSTHVGIGAVPSNWLFPGHHPGRPITASQLGHRLSAFGIDARAARRAAQQQLASQVPAVVLAEMLGVSISTAVTWVHAAGGDWANYAAVVTGENAQC